MFSLVRHRSPQVDKKWVIYWYETGSFFHHDTSSVRVKSFLQIALADLMGAPGTRAPWGPNSFIFMQFSAKKLAK